MQTYAIKTVRNGKAMAIAIKNNSKANIDTTTINNIKHRQEKSEIRNKKTSKSYQKLSHFVKWKNEKRALLRNSKHSSYTYKTKKSRFFTTSGHFGESPIPTKYIA